MIVARKSMITGEVHSMDVPISPVDLRRFENGEIPFVQDIKGLSADHREFLLTGITPEEWNTYIAEPEE